MSLATSASTTYVQPAVFLKPTTTTLLTLSGASIVSSAHLNADQIEYLAGMGAAIASVLVTFPINKIMFRQSIDGVDAFDAMRQLYNEGARSLFRGCLPPVMVKSINASVMFGTYHQYTGWLVTSKSLGPLYKDHPLKTCFVASMMSGATEAMLMTPFERVQSILQDGRLNNTYRNTLDTFKQLQKYGLTEYYRGLSVILLRNGPSTFLYFGFKDRLKDFLLPAAGFPLNLFDNSRKKEAIRSFTSGALLGSAISTIGYPLNVIKIHMMIRDVGTRHASIIGTAYRLYRDRGNRPEGMFSGMRANLVRSFLYWGCITVFSETLRDYFTEGA